MIAINEMKNRQHCETLEEYNLRLMKKRLINTGKVRRFYPRDRKGRFLSRKQWAVERLRYMVDKLMRREWYADESWVQYSRNDSGYDYYRNLARLYRSFRIKYRIYETF